MENIDPDDLAEIRFPLIFPGADLYRFDNTRDFARPEAIGGLGNVCNYGIRTIVPSLGAWATIALVLAMLGLGARRAGRRRA
ncbi:MAG: IPTL-CTERM sorting domain-containing protein [Thiohalocapsa sp.]|nr:IPTL-CTERM sorting domain-containing protein [Thiohalocapsa sp.]